MAVGTVKISRTPASTGNQKTYTLSYWVKRGDLANIQQIWNCYSSSSDYMYMRFTAANELYLESKTASSANIGFTTDRIFRDTSAWYHIVLAVDTAQSISTNRWKLYVNGVQETVFSASDYSTQDVLTPANKISFPLYIGADHNTDQGFNGEMSHVQLVDGLALAPTEFGEVDATSGIWTIKTSAYATPGTNGFYLKMEDRTNLDLDSSSNAFTFTTTGTLTATYDNPSNNFCTWNALSPVDSTFTYGNTKYTAVSNGSAVGTIAPTTGKWYWELKAVAVGSNYPRIGITRMDNGGDEWYETYPCGDGDGTARSWGSNNGGTSTKKLINGANSVLSGTAPFYSTGDILMFAMDLDNAKVWFGKDNVWYGNTDTTVTKADIVSNTATPAFSDLGTGNQWTPIAFSNGSSDVWAINCGNGDFEGTAITSPSADGAGIGAFKYAPPTGFYALCTKNLKTYG